MGLGTKEVTTGHVYWGSLALAICHGPVKRLYSIKNGDTIIWEGPIDSSSADLDGRTLISTSIGTIHFYWGTQTQNVNDLLSSLVIDLGAGPEAVPIPAWRGICYAVLDDVSFGGQTVPPTLRFDLVRETEGLEISAHHVEDDAIIPEAIHDFLTNEVYGDAVDPADINEISFEEAAEVTITEGLVASPDFDSLRPSREIIGAMLAYIDATIYWSGGKLVMKLNRAEDTTEAQLIDESLLLEEPIPMPTQFDETWNRTIVTFRDRTNKWEETSVDYQDKANLAIQGRKVTEVMAFPWITRREVAEVLAVFKGMRGGVPAMFWELKVMPSLKTLNPGDLIKLSFAKFGVVERVARIKSIGKGSPSEPSVSLLVYEERTRDISNDYFPPSSSNNIPGVVGEDGTGDFALGLAEPRLSWLPPELKAGEEDGFLVAVQRPAGMASAGEVWWTWNSGAEPYKLVASLTGFPAKGTLLSWHKVRETSWLLRVELSEDDFDRLQSLKEEVVELFAVVGARTVQTSPEQDEMIPTAVWMKSKSGGLFDLISETVIDIEVEAAEWFGSGTLALELDATAGTFPSEHIYFGRVEDFVSVPSSVLNFEREAGNHIDDADWKRYVKVPVSNFQSSQSVTDATATNYDRNAGALGTYSRSWGAAVLSMYETLDLFGLDASEPDIIGEVDAALWAILTGDETAEQTLIAEHVDDVLGTMATNIQDFYNA